MNRRDWGDVLAGVFLLAVITLLVRPSSLGPGFIRALGQAMTTLVSYTVQPSASASVTPPPPPPPPGR